MKSKNNVGRLSHCLLSLLSCIIFSLRLSTTTSSDPVNYHTLPGMHDKVYSIPGDINVGAIIVVAHPSSISYAEKCIRNRKTAFTIESTEAVAFAVDWVNRNPDILPNVTLGFVIRGTCLSLGPTLATALPFIPNNQKDVDSIPNNQKDFNESSCPSQNETSSGSNWVSHDVIGVLAPGQSSLTQPISSLYSVAHLPIVGATETSDELSDKKHHPYFFRVVTPETYQVKAMLRFISSNGWSYISVLYEDCYYNPIAAFDYMQQNVGRYGICLASSQRLSCAVDYEDVVLGLTKHPRARVVVLFMSNTVSTIIFNTIVNLNLTGHFIFMAPGFSSSGIKGGDISMDPRIGSFLFDTYTAHSHEFYDFLKQQHVNTTKSPWFRPMQEWLLRCSYNEGTCDPDADMFDSSRYRSYKGTSLRIDAILSLAHAAHDLLSERCPNARGKDARACITGKLLREYLRNTQYEGFVGAVSFDENQDMKGKYRIRQVLYDYERNPLTNIFKDTKSITPREVGFYDSVSDNITFYNETILWSHLDSLDRIVPWTEDSQPIDVPESVCSRPCLVGEYKIEKEVPCCWECRRCRENERLVNDNTSCEICPSFMWPDPLSGFTACEDIPLTYPSFSDTIPIILTSLAVMALVVASLVAIGYTMYRNERVIKASSRELSIIQLVAIFVGYATVILYQFPPNDAICCTIFATFCLSFVLIYAPLLIKTIRIFRIFKGGAKNKKPRFISPSSQIIFSALAIAVQVGLCAATFFLYSPGARRVQPIWTEKVVELSCDLTFPGLISFLGYNIVLVILCSVFAFNVRKLPDNFNESKFISMCVATTLLIWLAFIPSYFTAHREFVRVFLLSVALLLNHSVALIFLFVPKVYVAIFLPQH